MAGADQEDVLVQIVEWEGFFTPNIIRRGRELLEKHRLHDFRCTETTADALIITPAQAYEVSVHSAPDGYDDTWGDAVFSCTCRSKQSKMTSERGKRYNRAICPHEAALMLRWEEEHGPWRFEEPPEARQKRLEKQRLLEEAAARKKEAERLRAIPVDAASFFPGGNADGTFFDIRKAVLPLKTNEYAVRRARELLDGDAVSLGALAIEFGTDGRQRLSARGVVTDNRQRRDVRLVVEKGGISGCLCGCNPHALYYTGFYDPDFFLLSAGNTPLCEHTLAYLTRLREYILENDPGDATDRPGDSFFREMETLSAAQAEKTETAVRKKNRCVTLAPRISMEEGEAVLSFKVGLSGGRSAILRSFGDFLSAVEDETVFAPTKTVRIDFAAMDFDEDSERWLMFIQRRASEVQGVNSRLRQRSFYTPSLTARARETLTGASLDHFYDLAEGGVYDYRDRDSGEGSILVAHRSPRVTLATSPVTGEDGGLIGVLVTGNMPSVLRGSAGGYIFSPGSLSRITREEERFLKPFRAAADAEGSIRFRVGRERLAEFYYRILPRLEDSPYVELQDDCAEAVTALLPPEPAFTFRLDVDEENGRVTCQALVSYGTDDASPLPAEKRDRRRDAAQEARVEQAVRRYFSDYDPEQRMFTEPFSEDALYRLLTDGVAELNRFGTTEGSDAFRRSGLRPAPQLRVGVSIESGLLDISVLSKDMEPAELLAVLESYRLRKKYHRLRSGAFVDLTDGDRFEALETMMDGMDLNAADVIGASASVPLYRALYLDTLLEEHDALVSSRDRTYRALVKNFRTIRDADYEPPDAQAEVLRPYQTYGYKWLRTLAAAGFGGILADEMGLGKTLQTIALLESLLDAGEGGLCLVVCPASLIYNWQAEFERFAPGLDVNVIAGTAVSRRRRVREADGRTVLVTSYDLLRQDIASYGEKRFSVMVLDEAQYIKNQKAALTKAVKAVRADRRFALTGTPIENRLAELWSIFDFLMPGFLYDHAEFSRRFEAPITKRKDAAATERLKRMTAPFILRRRKEDVLKDLPPKLEEVRYTRFEDAQRRVYDGQVVRMKKLLTDGGGTGQDKMQIFAELTRIRQICCDPSLLFEDYDGGSAKREACLELIESAIVGGHRLLLFSQFTSMLALLEEDLRRENIPYYKLTGGTPKEQRARLVRDFNEGDTPVFLISLKAGGTGLNLTGADVVIHYDPWWNVAAQNQATDRAHRIGQEKQVTVYRMIVKDTIEERILALQEAKRDLADAILSGESTSITAMSNEELLALLS